VTLQHLHRRKARRYQQQLDAAADAARRNLA
jgi:hypothetical protein